MSARSPRGNPDVEHDDTLTPSTTTFESNKKHETTVVQYKVTYRLCLAGRPVLAKIKSSVTHHHTFPSSGAVI
jgi:hypothetical protein